MKKKAVMTLIVLLFGMSIVTLLADTTQIPSNNLINNNTNAIIAQNAPINGDPDDVIGILREVFPDAGLAQYISDITYLDKDQILHRRDLDFRNARFLNLGGSRVHSFEGMEYVRAGTVRLDYYHSLDLSPLQYLEAVELEFTNYSDVDNLTELLSFTNLKKLQLSDSSRNPNNLKEIDSFDFLASMTHLEEVNISWIAVRDNSIASLQASSATLRRITISETNLTNFEGLRGLSFDELIQLDLTSNRNLRDYSGFTNATMPKLIIANIHMGNSLSGWEHVDMPNLEYVFFSGTLIDGQSGNVITNLKAPRLKSLSFDQKTMMTLDITGFENSNYSALNSLTLRNAGIQDLTPLVKANFPILSNLNLVNNRIEDINGLSTSNYAQTLSNLSLDSNSIVDFSELAKMSGLRFITAGTQMRTLSSIIYSDDAFESDISMLVNNPFVDFDGSPMNGQGIPDGMARLHSNHQYDENGVTTFIGDETYRHTIPSSSIQFTVRAIIRRQVKFEIDLSYDETTQAIYTTDHFPSAEQVIADFKAKANVSMAEIIVDFSQTQANEGGIYPVEIIAIHKRSGVTSEKYALTITLRPVVDAKDSLEYIVGTQLDLKDLLNDALNETKQKALYTSNFLEILNLDKVGSYDVLIVMEENEVASEPHLIRVQMLPPSIRTEHDTAGFLQYEKVNETAFLKTINPQSDREDIDIMSDFSQSVDFYQAGEYEVKVKANYRDNESETKTIMVTIAARTIPIINAKETIEYYVNTQKSPAVFLLDIDASSSDHSSLVSNFETQVDTKRLGTYEVSVESNNDLDMLVNAERKIIKVQIIENPNEIGLDGAPGPVGPRGPSGTYDERYCYSCSSLPKTGIEPVRDTLGIMLIGLGVLLYLNDLRIQTKIPINKESQ